MPIGTVAAISTGAGLLSSGASILQGASQKKQAKKALEELKVPELDNVFEDIQISTLGSNLIREESQRTTAGLIDAAKSGGTRGVASSIGRIVALNNNTNNQARKLLDDQFTKREYAIAGDEQRIRGVKERRFENELAGIGNLRASGEQNLFNGIRGFGNSIASAGRNGFFNKGDSSLPPGIFDVTVPDRNFDIPSLKGFG